MVQLLERGERARWEAMRRRDRAALDTLLAEDFAAIGYAPSGALRTARREALGATGDAGVTDYALRDFHAVFAAPDVVVLTYRASGPFPILAASVWTRRGARWQMLFHQATAE